VTHWEIVILKDNSEDRNLFAWRNVFREEKLVSEYSGAFLLG